jgi:superfamily II DNA or RNA helicase
MKLLEHQVKFARGYDGKNLLVHETGTGKTVCACVWLRDGRDKNALVICPKRVVKKWEQALKDWGAKGTVISKEQFKKSKDSALKTRWSALVVDEADEFASPLFSKGRSQLSAALYDLVKLQEMPVLLLTATPIRSNPWNLHTLLCFLRIYIPYKKWRDDFFTLENRPYLPRPAWIPKPDWRVKMQPLLKKHADIVLLKDCVGDLPSATEEVIKLKSKPYVGNINWEATAQFYDEHRFEQKEKHKAILDIGRDYRKVLVVAFYIEQIELLAKQLGRDRETFVVHGSVKNQEAILKKANETEECFLIVQASLGAGFDADSFSCVVFASMAYGVRNYVQMKGRVRRIHNLHPVRYYYIHSGRCDKAVYDAVMKGKDFVPSQWKV